MILQQATMVIYLVLSFAPLMINDHIEGGVNADAKSSFKRRHLYVVGNICNIFRFDVFTFFLYTNPLLIFMYISYLKKIAVSYLIKTLLWKMQIF